PGRDRARQGGVPPSDRGVPRERRVRDAEGGGEKRLDRRAARDARDLDVDSPRRRRHHPHLLRARRGARPRITAARVSAASANAHAYTATDYALALPARVPSGLSTFALTNKGAEPHYVRFVRLADGHTVDDFAAWQKSGAPIPKWLVTAGGIG